MAQVHGGAAAFAQLSAIPDVRTARIVTPRVMQLSLRAEQPRSPTRRCARRSWLCSTSTCWPRSGAGSDNTVTLAQAQVRSPSDPGYVPTAPPALTQQAALALLESAGYVIDTDVTPVPTPVPLPHRTAATAAPPRTAPTRGRISKDGQQLAW